MNFLFIKQSWKMIYHSFSQTLNNIGAFNIDNNKKPAY